MAYVEHSIVFTKMAGCSRVCVCVCVCVCVRPQLSHAPSYIILLLCHIATSAVEANGSLQAQ